MSLMAELRGGFSPGRVGAMMLRYLYLLRSSWPRVVDLIYWPTVQMITWGFIQTFVWKTGASGPLAVGAGTLIGAVMLWDILFRGQLGFSMSFLEELYSRNLGNLMMSPLRPLELVAALMAMSVLRLAIAIVPVTAMAVMFFGFNLWGLGFALGLFFINLMLTSWSVGLLVAGLLLRNGLGAEALAWSLMFVLLPLACVYYPVSVLPTWLQPISLMLPPTHVFEGLRMLLDEHRVSGPDMAMAFGINAVLFAGALVAFLGLLESAKRRGTLLQSGE